MLDQYITQDEIMGRFKISKGTLANLRSQGKISYSKFGSSVVYKEKDIIEYLERNTIKKTA